MIIRHLLYILAFILFLPSQIFWLWQVRGLGMKFIQGRSARRWAAGLGLGFYLVLLAYNFLWPRPAHESPHLTIQATLLQAPFRWWMLASLTGFVAWACFYLFGHLGRVARWLYVKALPRARGESEQLLSPERRHFLTRAAVAVSATPFAACAYGMLYERTDILTTRERIVLPRLPSAFDGFRIAQVSDIHIGPFMPVEEIRRLVGMVNALKPDMIALTGDFVTWEGSPAGAVVDALAALKAPYGIYGCLGNHELWANVEDLITGLFAERGIKILRHQNAAVSTSGEAFNLIGVDYQTRALFGPPRDGVVTQYLEGVENLMHPGTANILMSHNPNTFDRAAELGIDLSLAGHTHGGQVAMEYISPNISPARLITPYVRGWFQKGQSQLYVNRGIGTIFSPVRFGSPPEITAYELKRS